jgi:hypothetical protein
LSKGLCGASFVNSFMPTTSKRGYYFPFFLD